MATSRSSTSPDSTSSDFVGGQFQLCRVPDVETTASDDQIVIGDPGVFDTATITDDGNPVTTGTVTFWLCGPTAAPELCDDDNANAIAAGSDTVDANGQATSDTISPDAPGWYCFFIHYEPAAGSKFFPADHANTTTECFEVLPASPDISTAAEETVLAGASISDSATLSGGYNPTGTITFSAYGPDDENCSGTAAYTEVVDVDNGNDTYGPVSFTPDAAGTYRWIAAYSGDDNNNSVAGACNDEGENDQVNKVQPEISTSADESVTIGGSISDQAELSGGTNPTGTITFEAFGPDDDNCDGEPAYSETVNVDSGNGTYGPVSFVPTATGTYNWIASYSGDVNNEPAAGACGDEGEVDEVNPETPEITTNASPDVSVGGDIWDTATLSGGFNPTGSITFNLYGPDDADCSDSIFDSTVTVDGNGDYDSDPFTTSEAGTYRWIASYSGDANNDPVSGACNDENESVVVNKLQPSITTLLSDGETSGTHLSFPIGTTVHDSATLTGATPDAGGTVTYTVYTDSECTDEFADAGTKAVVNGVVGDSDGVTFNAAGTYYWQAEYSGDDNNEGAISACTDETVEIVPNEVTINTLLSGQGNEGSEITVQIGHEVTDSATLTGETADAGGTVTYTVYRDDQCSIEFADGGTVDVTNGVVPDSDPVLFDEEGTFYWQAEYSGDANNEAAISACTDEIVNVVVPSINIEKDVDDADRIVGQGQLLTYTLELTVVNGPVTLSTVSDPLPEGQEFVSASHGGVYDVPTRTINWDLGTLQSGDPILVLTYDVQVAEDALPGDQPNTATFDTDETPPDDSSELVTVPDVTIVKDNEDADGVAGPGQTVTYTIDVTVIDGPVTDAVVTDHLPAGQTYVNGSQSSDPAATFEVLDGGSTLRWSWDSLDEGAHISYDVTIDADAEVGEQTNTVEICVSELTNCKPGDSTVEVPALTIVKSYTGNTAPSIGEQRMANVGDTLTYTLTYDLTGGPVHNGVITDTLPVGLTYVADSATNNDEFTFVDYDAASRTLTWHADLVSKDGSVTYQVTVDEDSFELPQPLVNVATIDSDETPKDDDDENVGVQEVFEETSPPTLPPTDTVVGGSDQAPSNPGFGLMLALLVIAGVGLVMGYITPKPGRTLRAEDRR